MSNIVLHKQGDSVVISQHGQELSEYKSGITKLKALLNWQAGVDLDIHAFYRTKDDNKDHHIFYGNKGKKNKSPYIHLDKDDGVGNIAGDNQEIITIGALTDIDSILIATNIFRMFGNLFSEGDTFAKYDGEVKIVTSVGEEIVVPLSSSKPGRWCVIALIDNSDPYSPMVSNINKITEKEPKIDDYLDDDILELTYDE